MKRTLVKDTLKLIGQTIKLQGWVDSKRDHGKVTFIDLRDRSGKIQCARRRRTNIRALKNFDSARLNQRNCRTITYTIF